MGLLKIAGDILRFVNGEIYHAANKTPSGPKTKFLSLLTKLDSRYDMLNKDRVALELKRAKAQLSAYHGIKEGTLIKSLVTMNARTENSIEQYKTDWVEIPRDSMFMFLGVDHDRNYDAVVLKVLWESKVYFIHKNANFADFGDNLRDKFEVLQ